MAEDLRLKVLKNDLEILHNEKDLYLIALLTQAEKSMEREGITITATTEMDITIASYAAFLYRRRGGTNTEMPRFLRYQLNNILFAQKGAVVDES